MPQAWQIVWKKKDSLERREIDMEKIVFVDLKKANHFFGAERNVVSLRISGKTKCLALNKKMTKELQVKKHSYVKVGVGQETGNIYLVFNNDSGYPIPDVSKYKSSLVLHGKDLIAFMASHFKVTEDTQFAVSENQANSDEYTTYILSLPKNAKAEGKPSVEKKRPGRKKKEAKMPEPTAEKSSNIQNLDAPVEDILKLNGDDLKDLGVSINDMTKNTINKFGSLGDVYASNPDDLIHKERGVGRKKVTFLQSMFNGLGLNWK